MADFSKRIAVLALAAAAGCADSFPPVAGPLDRFYYPVGMALRRLPGGNTALLVVSTNFDLKYDYDVGGAVLAVDPDASGDARPVAEGGEADPTLSVLGGLNIGSFGGEVAYLDDSCAPLAAADQVVADGGAKVVAASRGKQEVYRIDMDAQGGLACDGCAEMVRPEALDPYGVEMVCGELNGEARAAAYVTQLRSAGQIAWLSKVDLLAAGPRATTSWRLGQEVVSSSGVAFTSLVGPTFTSVFLGGRLFVTSRLAIVGVAPLRWLDVFLEPTQGELLLIEGSHDVGQEVHGAIVRQLLASADGRRAYLLNEIYDSDLSARTGALLTTGGALAVYDVGTTASGEPAFSLRRLVPTCFGAGQMRLLPRAGRPDLIAITCDDEGDLVFYDDEVGTIVWSIGRDETTGRPRLGRQPFGLVVEEREAGRCLPPRVGDPPPAGPCTRLYVASFDRSWVSLIELDKENPAGARIVKRLGAERE